MKPILLAPTLLLLTACILNPQTYPVLSPADAAYDAANRSVRTGNERSRIISFCTDYNANRGMPADLAAKRCACTYDIARPQFTDAQWRRPSTNPNSRYMRRMDAAVRQCKRLYPTADARPDPPHISLSQYRRAFIDLCARQPIGRQLSRNQSVRLCTCTYDNLRSRYSTREWQQFIDSGRNPQHDPVFKRRMGEATAACMRRYNAY